MFIQRQTNIQHEPIMTILLKLKFGLLKEAGLAIGGQNFYPYVMLEVHINNEKMESGRFLIEIVDY